MSDSTKIEDKIAELLYIFRELQRDSNNINNIRAMLQLNSITPTQPLHKYGWKFCELCTTHSNVYDCVSYLCNKIAQLETTVENLKKDEVCQGSQNNCLD